MPLYETFRPLESTPTALVNWGNDATVLPNADEVIVVDMRARCTVGEAIAVVFGVDDRCKENAWCEAVDDPNSPLVLLRATLYWGLGCASFSATMDLRHGAVVYLPAETIRVGAYMIALPPLTPDPDEEIPCAPPLIVSAGFAYGGVREFASLTEPVRVRAGKRQLIPVPSYASGFSIIPSDSQTIRVRARAGSGPNPIYESTGPQDQGNFFPLPNGVRCLEIDNTAGLANLEGFIIFRLSL